MKEIPKVPDQEKDSRITSPDMLWADIDIPGDVEVEVEKSDLRSAVGYKRSLIRR